MSESQATEPSPASGGATEGPIPFMQRLLDNPFLLLFIGVVVPTVFYLIWGNYEMVLTITPDETGVFSVVCNEFCGIGHHVMLGRIYVVEPGGGS